MEKVHGSNFCLSTDGREVHYGKRTSWLEPGDTSYFPVASVVTRHSAALARLYNLLDGGQASNHKLFVYGELYGGVGEEAVQNELFYRPTVDFVAFDVLWAGSFLDYSRAMLLMSQAGIPCLQPLMQGTLSECFAFNVDFASQLSEEGHPAEGYVVKCLVELGIEDDRKRLVRAVAKRKSARFLERAGTGAVVGRERVALASYASPGRLSNVVSKLGKPKSLSVSQVVELMIADALEEAREDAILRVWLDKYPKDAEKLLRAPVTRLVRDWSASLQ